MFTEEIIEEIGGPEWVVARVGIDAKSDEKITKNRQLEFQTYKTIEEASEEAGLEKLGDEKGGNVIENAVWMHYMNAKQMASMGSSLGGGLAGGEQAHVR